MQDEPKIEFDLKEYLDKQFAEQTRLHEAHQKATQAHVDRLEGRMDGLEGRMDGVERRLGGVEGRLGELEGRVDGLTADVDDLKKGQEKIYDMVQSNSRKLAKFDGELIFIRPIVIGGVVAFLIWLSGVVLSNVCPNVNWC